MFKRSPVLPRACIYAAGLLLAGDAGAQGRESQIIRGCVSTKNGAAVSRAAISVTRAPDRHVERDTTATTGCYSIRISPATGDYLLSASAIGYRPFRTRVTTASDTALTVNVELASIPTLSTVNVQAQRPSLSRSNFARIDPGSGEVIADGVNSALTPDQQGDLAAVAGTVPGILSTPNGASTLGLGSDQNSATLDGMAFGGAKLPRDAHVQTHVASSTYDPSRGGFGGAQVAVELIPGSEWNEAQGHIAVDAPFAQANDPVASGGGDRFTRVVGSVGSTGELVPDRYSYNVAADVSRSVARRSTLENDDPAMLGASGMAPDSARALVSAIGDAGLPIAMARDGAPDQSTDVTLLGRIDHTPWKRQAWGITGYGRTHRGVGVGAAPTATRGQLGHDENDIAAVYANRSVYFSGTSGLNETKTGVTVGRQKTVPNSFIPQGIVLVPTSGVSAQQEFAYAAFGGDGGLASDARDWSWETINQTSWLPRGGHHAVKLSLGTRLDGFSRAASGNRFGRFDYTSIADVAANRPVSFLRSLDTRASSGDEWTAYASLGDHWYASRSIQFLYGLRLDGNRYLSTPGANPEVSRAFGVRNNGVPSTIGISPRLGFTWIYSQSGAFGGKGSQGPWGTVLNKPGGAIRGGIGLFRGALPVTLIDRAIRFTGTSSSNTISCVGSAVPTPNWPGYANGSTPIPDGCAGSDGAPVDAGRGLIQSGGTVSLFDPHYAAPESWRASLEWLPQFPWFTFSAQGTYSLNLHQPGSTDLNFNGAPQFHLPDEDRRPVFVPASNIVGTSGALTSIGSRRDDAFTTVTSNQSDAKSVARQLVFSVSPRSVNPDPFYFRASWALSGVRQFGNGFDYTTFGNPLERGWSPALFDIRNQLQLQFSYYYRPLAITFTLYGNATSGLPFTPIVGGDINGDGSANDRAFIFNPATAPDAAVASGIAALLASGDSRVAKCLSSQLGRPAGANSCRGPWSQTLNMRVSFGNAIPGTSGRAWAALDISNAISGVDQLLHGASHLRGWGLTSIPDPVLLRVTGFDPVALRYKYAVNHRFGTSSVANIAYRNPFRITLDIQLDLAKPLQAQQLDKWLGPGRAGRKGPRLSASALRLKYGRTVPDIYRLVLEQADSLLLSPDQVNALTLADERYRPRVDSVWTSIGEYLVGLPDNVDAVEALHHVDAATTRVWALARAESPTMRAILTLIQLQLVPYTVNLVVNTKRPLKGGLIFAQ
ncbi:MAG: carboxypeptidase-like regulatory domain-containing protein [Gemmatimonadaceae bacterium]